MADDINLGIGFDISGAKGEEDDIEKKVEALDGKSVTVNVDADTKDAAGKIDALSQKKVVVGVRSEPVKAEVIAPEPVRVEAVSPTVKPKVEQPDPVRAEVRVPENIKPDVKQPDPVKVKVETPTVRPKVEMPKETSFSALLDIADATGDVDRFQKKLFDLRGSVPIDVIVNCNGALADMRRELASGAPDAEKLQRSNEALAESLRNIGVGNLAKIGTSYTNLTASIKQVSDAVKTGVAEAAEETGTRIEASVDGLIGAIDQLDKKAGEYGTVQARQIQGTLAEMRNALKDGADLDSDTLEGLSQWFEKLIEQGNKLPPAGLVKMGKELQKVGSSYADFQKAIEDKNAVEWKIDLKGLDRFDELNRKIEIVQSAQGLDEGVKGLQAALADLDPKNAAAAEKIITRLKVLMTQELNADTLKEMNAEIAKFGRLQAGMTSKEIAKFGPAIQKVQSGFGDLQGKIAPLRDELKGLFDASSMSSSVLSGNIEGVAQGLVGLAAGAGKAAGAMKALGNSLAIGIIITGLMQIVKLTKGWITKTIDERKEMERMRLDSINQTVETINQTLENRVGIIQRINEETKRGIDIEHERANAIREAAKAQADLAKSKELMNARGEGEKFEIEQRHKEANDQREFDASMEESNSQIAKMDADIRAAEQERDALKQANTKLQKEMRNAAQFENDNANNDDSYWTTKLRDWGITDDVENVKSAAEAQQRIQDQMNKNNQRIKEIEGTKAGKDGKKAISGEIDILKRERENIVLRQETIKSQKAVIDSENRVARVQEARRIHMERANREEALSREEYDRNEQERQFNRRQRQAEGGYGENLQDAREEVDHWAQEESDENRTVNAIRAKYADKMSDEDHAKYDDLRSKDAALDQEVAEAQNDEERQRALAKQREIRDRIAELEQKYYKEMEEEDRFRLQNALNYRASARNNFYAAKEAVADMERQRRREDEARQHGYDLEDEAFQRERILKRHGSYGQEAIQKKELARGEKDFEEANTILQDAAAGKIKLSRDDEIKYERQREEARQRITTARSALDDIQVGREDRLAEFKENMGKNSNRLTAMGLGSGDVGFGKDVASNTKELVTLTKEMLSHFKGQKSDMATRRHSAGITWS